MITWPVLSVIVADGVMMIVPFSAAPVALTAVPVRVIVVRSAGSATQPPCFPGLGSSQSRHLVTGEIAAKIAMPERIREGIVDGCRLVADHRCPEAHALLLQVEGGHRHLIRQVGHSTEQLGQHDMVVG